MTDTSIIITVIDDESAIRNMLGTFLKMKGYEVYTYNGGVAALDNERTMQSHVVISDLNMPDMDGLTLLKKVKSVNSEAVCILITGMATLDSTITALRTGVDDYILKPFDLKDLQLVIEKNISRLLLKSENENLQADILRERNRLKQKNIELEIINDTLYALRSSYDINVALDSLRNRLEMIFPFDASFHYAPNDRQLQLQSGKEIPATIKDHVLLRIRSYFLEKPEMEIADYLRRQLKVGETDAVISDLLVQEFRTEKEMIGVWGFMITDGTRYTDKHREQFSKMMPVIQDLISQVDTIVENQNRILSSIFNQIQSILIRVDLDTGEILTNNLGRQLLEIGRRSVGDDLHFADVQRVLDGNWEHILSEIGKDQTYRANFLVGDEKDSLVFGVSVMPYQDPPVINNGLLITARDITDIKKIEDMKADLISNVSHELKTPVAIIKEYLSLLNDQIVGPVNEMQGNFIHTIGNNLDRLERLIMNFLDMSKLNSGKLVLKFHEEDVTEIIKSIIEPFHLRFSKKGMQFDTDIPEPGTRFTMDRDMFSQVIVNLLENAYKYAGENASVKLMTKIEENGHLMIKVADTGKGIARKDQSKIFDRFFRAGLEDDVRLPGTGLGLSIIKDMLELIGGRIWLESEVGVGTTFFAEIPAGTIQKQQGEN